jgi:hypothetical protein
VYSIPPAPDRENHLGRSLFDGHVRRDELDGVGRRFQLGAFRTFENGGKLLFDRFAADDLLATERVRVDSFGRPQGGQCLRVPLIERGHVSLHGLADRRLVRQSTSFGLAIRFGPDRPPRIPPSHGSIRNRQQSTR